MTIDERKDIEEAMRHIENARIIMGSWFDRKGNEHKWSECEYYQSMRGILAMLRELLDSHLKIHENM